MLLKYLNYNNKNLLIFFLIYNFIVIMKITDRNVIFTDQNFAIL